MGTVLITVTVYGDCLDFLLSDSYQKKQMKFCGCRGESAESSH